MYNQALIKTRVERSRRPFLENNSYGEMIYYSLFNLYRLKTSFLDAAIKIFLPHVLPINTIKTISLK